MNALQQQELDELETLSEETKQRFQITDLNSLNWTLRKLAALDVQEKEVSELATAEIERIQAWQTSRVNAIQNSRDYLESLIAEYARTQREVDPKWKAKTPYGKVGYRKQQPEWDYWDEKQIIESLEEGGYDDLIKVEKKPIKTELKKRFTIVGDSVVDQATGEIIRGVRVMEREDKLEIKVEV